MAENKNGYWKGFTMGILLLPVVGLTLTLVSTIVMAIVTRKTLPQ